MPQFGFYPSQLFWLMISFGILFCAMQFWLLPPVAAIIKQREDKINALLNQARDLTQQAQELETAYQQAMDIATQRSSKMIQRAHDEIAAKTARQEEELLKHLQENIQKTQYGLKSRQKTVLNNLEKIACTFIQTFLNVCYDLFLPEKELQIQIRKNIKDIKNVQ